MVWFFIIINFYFDYVVALMLGALLAYIAAKAAVHLRFLEPYVIMNRILAYIFLLSFTLLFCVTFVVTKTDPEFSVIQRYRQAFDTVRGWIWKHDPFLEKGGLEQALRMQTHWVAFPEQVFFTRDGELYSIFTDGQQQRLRFLVQQL
jgi:predicted PurR-regulated permease PerM